MADRYLRAGESEGCPNGSGGSVADKNKLPDRVPMDRPPSSPEAVTLDDDAFMVSQRNLISIPLGDGNSSSPEDVTLDDDAFMVSQQNLISILSGDGNSLEAVEQAAEVELANGPMISNNAAAQGINNAWLGDGGRQQQPNRSISRSITSDRAALNMSTAILEVDGNDDDTTMRDLEANRNPIARLVPTCPSKEQLVRALWILSNASLFVGVNVGLHEPTAMGSLFARHQAIYYSIIVAILAAVPIEMATAIWLQHSNDLLFHTFAEVIQRVGVVLLLIVSALGGVELTVKV